MKKTDGKNEKVELKIIKNHRNRYFGWFDIGSGAFFYVDFISGPGFANKVVKSRFFDDFWKNVKNWNIFIIFFGSREVVILSFLRFLERKMKNLKIEKIGQKS